MIKEVYTKEEAKSLRVGFYAAALLIVVGTVFALTRDNVAKVDNGGSYIVDARFNRTDGLLVGDMVRMAGVDVGKVVNAKLDAHFKAILTMEVKEKVKIPEDSSASIVSSALMGPKYIEIEPGGSEEMLKPGGEFSYTQDAMILEELLDRIVGIGKANRGLTGKTDGVDKFDLDE